MNYYAILKWYQLENITDVIGEVTVDRFKLFKETVQNTTLKPQQNIQKEEKQNKTDPALSIVSQAENLSQQAQNLEDLHNRISSFDGCSLKKTSLHTFVGVGNTNKPRVFCVFDAPKAQADKTGNLFDGPNGNLLQKMLASINLSTDNCYVAPLIPWRLPGDRKPTQTEELISLPFLKKQIEFINPDFILIFGAVATKNLLNIESISKARQQNLFIEVNGAKKQVVTTFGPEMVSISQVSRKNAWDDLKKLAQLIQEKDVN